MQQSKDRAVRWQGLDLIGSEMKWTKLKKEEGRRPDILRGGIHDVELILVFDDSGDAGIVP